MCGAKPSKLGNAGRFASKPIRDDIGRIDLGIECVKQVESGRVLRVPVRRARGHSWGTISLASVTRDLDRISKGWIPLPESGLSARVADGRRVEHGRGVIPLRVHVGGRSTASGALTSVRSKRRIGVSGRKRNALFALRRDAQPFPSPCFHARVFAREILRH
jgi:hypothetical protein